ncbi:glycosyltransferase [Vicingaceae bacterium]|nr:glycosyltransferase [Vicingaceae bacterium]
MNNKILIFIDWFYPAYKAGGPVKSVYNIAMQLKDDFDFYIVTSNQDVDGEFLDVPLNKWTTFQNIKVIYLSKENQNNKQYSLALREVNPELIYYNSLFSFRFTLKPYFFFRKRKVKQIIAPRGMLGAGALFIKPIKKKFFLTIARMFLFEREFTFWHATSLQEADEIKFSIGSEVQIKIAMNLSSAIRQRNIISKQTGELNLVFISRISEKKNLLFILEILASLKKEINIYLSIYGPIEDALYWNMCMSKMEGNPKIEFKGILKPDEISETLQQYHFYILPTLHENYGHSIVEAILCGVPVILSQNTPWRNLQAAGIGADLDLKNKEEWKSYLQVILDMSQEYYDEKVKSCYSYAEEYILNPKTLKDSKQLFTNAKSSLHS